MSHDREALKEIIAKDQMRDVLFRYCRCVDRMDWETVRTCFHPDAVDEHGLYSGPIDGLIQYFRNWAGEQYKITTHLIGNIMIEIHGDHAVAESYCISYLRIPMEKATRPEFRRLLDERTAARLLDEREIDTIDLKIGLRMVDRFERRGTEKPWLIAHRVIVHEWNRLDPVHFEMKTDGNVRCGRRDQADLIFKRLGELGQIASQDLQGS